MPIQEPHVIFGTLSRLSRDASEPDYLRLEIDGLPCYANTACFANPEFLNRLKPGDKLTAGVHGMEGSTYWIHWLATAAGILEPQRKRPKFALHFVILLLGVCLFLTSLAALVAASATEVDAHPYAPFGLAAGIVLFLFGLPALRILINRMSGQSNAIRILDTGLERIRNAETNIEKLTPASGLPCPDAIGLNPELVARTEGIADAVEGTVSEIGVEQRRNARGSHGQRAVSFDAYSFKCGEQSTRWLSFNPKQADPWPHSDFPSTPPDFLGKGDRVTLLVPRATDWRDSNQPPDLCHPQPGDAAILVNHADGREYLPAAFNLPVYPNLRLSGRSLKAVVIAAAAVVGFIMVLGLPTVVNAFPLMLAFGAVSFMALVSMSDSLGDFWHRLRGGADDGKRDVFEIIRETSPRAERPEKVPPAAVCLFKAIVLFFLAIAMALMVLAMVGWMVNA